MTIPGAYSTLILPRASAPRDQDVGSRAQKATPAQDEFLINNDRLPRAQFAPRRMNPKLIQLELVAKYDVIGVERRAGGVQ